MNVPSNPLARQHLLVVQEHKDETLIYDLVSHKAHCLNSSAAFVWKACDGHSSVSDIVGRLTSTGNGKVTNEFVEFALAELSQRDLLDNSDGLFRIRSRREVVKKLVAGSAVALPLIMSLTMPPNARGFVSTCGCRTNSDCIGQFGCSSRSCNPFGMCAP